jgi:hypothetical protein
MNRGEWSRQFLAALGNTQPTPKTVNFVASWTLGENTAAKFNPLATTQPHSGATDFNAVGVKNYATHQDGIDATVTTIKNGRYPHVLRGLETNDPEQAVNALELGTWGTGLGFTTLWRLGDHTGETLLSHAGDGGGSSSGGSWEPKPPGPLDWLDPTSPQYDAEFNAQNEAMTAENITRSVSFIALGVLLLGIALVLAIRTYVPTSQIVKTIAAVA